MEIEDHIAVLRVEGELMAQALARGDMTAPVPSCPKWTLGELGRHTGRIHRWGESIVRLARVDEMSDAEQEQAWGPMPDDASLVDWFRDGHAQLVRTLVQAPSDLDCWSLLPGVAPLLFWARREAHETTIHRVDAELGLGPVAPVSTASALDGIGELLSFYPGPPNRLRCDPPATLRIAPSDGDISWLVRIGPDGAGAHQERDGERELGGGREPGGGREGGAEREEAGDKTDAVFAGPAAALFVALWNRGPLSGPGTAVVVTGDPGLADVWREGAQIR